MAGAGTRSDGALVGRRVEQDLLDALLDRAAAGEAHTALVTGDIGAGKSTLVRAVAARRADAIVLAGACLPLLSADVPLLAVRDMLRGVDAALGAPQIDASLSTAVTLARIDDWLTGLCAQGPVILVIDDVQWADQASLDVLTYLIAGPSTRCLAILATLRRDEVGERQPLHRWLGNIRRLPRVREVALGPLTRAETAEHIAAVLGQVPHQSLVDDVFAHTNGNPYLNRLIVEGLAPNARAVSSRLPRDLRSAVLATWEELSESAREPATALAIAGTPLGAAVLGRVLGRDEPSMLRELRNATRAGLLSESADGSFWFRHPFSAEVLEGVAAEVERARLHATFADHLEAAFRPGDVSAATAIADHRDLAGDPVPALESALRAAEEAERGGRWADAMRMLDCAIARVPAADGAHRASLLRRLRSAAAAAGALERELTAVDELLALTNSDDDPGAVGELLVRRMRLRFSTGLAFFDVEEAQCAVEVTAAIPHSAAHALALAESAHAGLWNGVESAGRVAERALETARRTGDDRALACALSAHAMHCVLSGDNARGLAAGTEAVDAAFRARDWWGVVHAALWEANAGETWSSQSYAVGLSRRREQLVAAGAPHAVVAWIAASEAASSMAAGEWRDCEARLRDAFSADPGPLADVEARLAAARLAAGQGRPHEAEQHLARAEELFDLLSEFLAFPLRCRVRRSAPGGRRRGGRL